VTRIQGAHGRGRSGRRVALALAGCALGVGLFGPLVDLAARAGWLPDRGPPPHFRPVTGADGRPLLDEAGQRLFAINPDAARKARDEHGDRLSAPREKPAHGFRILSLGESTTFGVGYGGRASYSLFLEMRLRARYGRDDVEVVNCGRSGYDSHDWPTLAAELADFAPDALVIYAGHNEFKRPNLLGVLDPFVAWLQRSPRAKLLLGGSPDRAIEPQSVVAGGFLTPEQRGRGVRLFEEGVRALLDEARRLKIPVVLCIPASNVRDHAPRCSRVPAGGDAAALVGAVRSAPFGEAPADLARIDELLAMAPDAALLHWRRGRWLYASHRDDEARAEFTRSLALDELPERASPDLLAVLRELGRGDGVVVADVEARIAQASERGVPGFDLFFDYCHPNLLGHFVVADAILAALEQAGTLARLGKPDDAKEPAGDFAARFEAWRARLDFSEEDAARQNVERGQLLIVECGTRGDTPAEHWRRPLEMFESAAKQFPPLEREASYLLSRMVARAGAGEGGEARADLRAARRIDAAATKEFGQRVARLPGVVAALAGAAIVIEDGELRERPK
jgi:lysophospholipase L1-like esterase